MKKYRIKLKEQWFDFNSYYEAKLRALELLHQNCWWFQLETLEESEKKEEVVVEKPKKKRGKTKRYKLNYKAIYGDKNKKEEKNDKTNSNKHNKK